MPLNDDIVLGKLTDPKAFPGDSQEDLNLDLMLAHDQNLLLKYVRKHIGRYTFEDLMSDLRESDDIFWEKILKAIIQNYSLETLEMFITDTPTESFSAYVKDLLRDLKVTLLNDIMEDKIKSSITREEFEKSISEYKSVLLKWCIKFITKEDYDKFIKKIFEECRNPIYEEGDDV